MCSFTGVISHRNYTKSNSSLWWNSPSFRQSRCLSCVIIFSRSVRTAAHVSCGRKQSLNAQNCSLIFLNAFLAFSDIPPTTEPERRKTHSVTCETKPRGWDDLYEILICPLLTLMIREEKVDGGKGRNVTDNENGISNSTEVGQSEWVGVKHTTTFIPDYICAFN